MRPFLPPRLPLVALVAPALAACGTPADAPVCAPAPVTSALFGGTDRPQFLALGEGQARAVVQVFTRDDHGAEHFCTGTFLGNGWLLSASHCLPANAEVTEVRHEQDAGLPIIAARVGRVERYPQLDLALLHAEGPALDTLVAIPVATALPPDFSRRLLQLAGTGLSEDNALGRRLFSVAQVVSVGAQAFSVSADGYAGLCIGDSGGPALLRADDGRVAVAGVLAAGSASCRGSDDFVRVDIARDWVAATVGPPPAPDTACGTLDAAGRCFGELAVWCAVGVLRSERCANGRNCGWDAAAAGHRCTPAAADPCRGIDSFGICQDGDALHCVDGRLRRNTCRQCGAQCARSPRTGIVTCAPPDRPSLAQ